MKNEKELNQILAKSPVRIGEQFRHYRTKNVYTVQSLAFREEDLQLSVNYSRENSSLVWNRTLENFVEKVINENGIMVSRFEKI